MLAFVTVTSCRDDDPIGVVERDDLLQFDFPQGTDAWDKEIEQIAKDWGMYIIYKDIDSTDLNMTWSVRPTESTPVLVAEPVEGEEVSIYLDLIKNYLLANLDNTKESDLRQLPYYFYLVKDMRDGNPDSPTYNQTVSQIYKDGFNYWALNFSSEDLANGLTTQQTHLIACNFNYPGLDARFRSGEYPIPTEFSSISDYETRVGVNYVSLEEYIEQYGSMGEMMYQFAVNADEKDEANYYRHRGFAPSVTETFELEGGMFYSCPQWMPWIIVFEQPEFGIYDSRNPNQNSVPDVEGRILEDFLNMVRLAMLYTEERMEKEFPVDVEDPYEANGNSMVMEKYHIVVDYLLENYNVDLQAIANILNE